LRGRAVNRCRW